MNVSNDDFVRTTEKRHADAVHEMWCRMEANGDIYLDSYAGWYSVSDEAFFTEADLEKQPDGSFLTKEGRAVEWVEEPSYFFRLSKYEDALLKLYDDQPDFIRPATRRNEIASFVKGGLRDLSISRTSFKWGIPVENDPEHIVYVWLDALTNYITGLGFPDEQGAIASHWPADVHVIGKDIIRFHTVYWPAFLMSAGLALPKRVFVHGFLYLEGVKMSKSLGNVITPEALVEEFGLDQMRYFLCREVPFGNDGNYSHESIVHRVNGDLANGLGNLAQRTLSMVFKNCDGVVPAPGALTDDDNVLLDQAEQVLATCRDAIATQAIHTALEAVWQLIGNADVYIARHEPWALKKTDPARMETVLYVAAETVRNVALLSQPVIPDSATKLLDMLGVAEDARLFKFVGGSARLAPGTPIAKPEGLFPRIAQEDAA